jgi:DNA gyrase subunit A
MSKQETPENNQEFVENISPAPLVDEMKKSYLDYAMSVIVSRALPDVRDGLKPVHRRILYAMWTNGLKSTSKFRKSAHTVGEVMAKYHPHGDASIYDSLVRMAQDFNMRHMLVNGQGNFGSMDGDSAAAMRYTESKLHAIADEMLQDIEKKTVDFRTNYDDSTTEPTVLPSKLPNLLLNGSMGIAVGMATNIPPHNLSELCDGLLHLIEDPKATIDDLTEHIKGPDFPTGGTIYSKADIKTTYATGRGGIVIRAKTEIQEGSKGTHQIVISEIPYQVNKARMIEKMATLVQEKKIDGIKDLRDESNKDGVRVVVYLKKDAYPKKTLNRLYKLTDLQTTFHVNTIALIDGIQPRLLNLKTILEEHIKHRQVVVRRRAEYDLALAEARAHILEGLKMALDKIELVIKTIRASKDKDVAKVNLIEKFKFSDRQAQAILEMRLQQLANLESKKIEDELKEKLAIIKALKTLLASDKKILDVIREEIAEIKEKYGEPRRTKLVAHGVKDFNMEDLIPNEQAIVMITRDGYIKRLPEDTFKRQSRGGKGVIGLTTKEEDEIQQVMSTNTHDQMLFFTTRGRVFKLRTYDVPVASRTAKGQALVNFLQLAPNESVAVMISMQSTDGYNHLVMGTTKGTIKKTKIKDFDNVRSSGIIAIKLENDDMLGWVRPTTGKDDIMMVTADGQSIRMDESKVRAMGRAAKGVRGIKLKSTDEVVGMEVVGEDHDHADLLVISQHGLGKRTPLKEYKIQGRGGSGIRTMAVTAKTGPIIGARIVDSRYDDDILMISTKGQVIRTPVKKISKLGRSTQGVRVMRFKATADTVASIAIMTAQAEEDEPAAEEKKPAKKAEVNKK